MEPLKDFEGNLVYGPDGEPIMTPVYDHTPSDSLLMFLLSGRNPSRFKSRTSTEMSGPNGGPIEVTKVDTSKLTVEELREMERMLLAATPK